MRKKLVQAMICAVSASAMLTVAAVNAPATESIETVQEAYVTANTPRAGITYNVSATLSNSIYVAATTDADITTSAICYQITPDSTPEEVCEATVTAAVANADFSNIGIAAVNDYVNIRVSADKDAEACGKLYKNDAAIIIDEDDEFYHIMSGSVDGYVSKEYIAVDDNELIEEAGTYTATVTADGLRVHKEPSEESGIITVIRQDDEYEILDDSIEGWVKIKAGRNEGYVSADYVATAYDFSYGESSEEEMLRLFAEAEAEAKKQAEREKKEAQAAAVAAAEAEAAAQAAANPEPAAAPASGNGAAVVNYASQFVGNRYRAGGSSLTNGTDCSGFVMSVYSNFGVSLPHSSSAMRSCGTGVDVSQMQAGDIVCYSGHVGIYTGNGTIVNALNARNGITYTDVNYKSIICVRRVL